MSDARIIRVRAMPGEAVVARRDPDAVSEIRMSVLGQISGQQ